MKSKKIIIVTGISNAIGKEFMRYYSYDNNHIVVGISRTKLCNYGFKNTTEIQIDLLNKQSIVASLTQMFDAIVWQNIEECVFIHSAGKSKNDQLGIHEIIDANGDGIDDEMYEAQITTFENLHTFIVEYLLQKEVYKNIKMTIVGFGSLIDKRMSPIHFSMRSVNNITRDRFHALSASHYNYHAIILSVSTVATATETVYRKYADQAYWLTASEVVDKSIQYIESGATGYEDIPIYKYHPLYEIYFKQETIEQLIERFKKEVGLAQ